MKGKKLQDYLLGKGLKQPEPIKILVEPYHHTKYLGSVLRHPNFPGFLIEYHKRDSTKEEERVNRSFICDSYGAVLIGMLDINIPIRDVLKSYFSNLKNSGDEKYSYQME